jgi:hypothetical protein
MHWSDNAFFIAQMITNCMGLLLKAGCWWLVMIAILGWRDPALADGE